MADAELVKLLKAGVPEWNKQPRYGRASRGVPESGEDMLDLVRADLRHTNLEHADLSSTNLECADLSGANLNDTTFSGAYAVGATLIHAKLVNSNLSFANFASANFKNAALPRARLESTNLTGGDVSKSNCWGTTFLETMLKGTNFFAAEFTETVFGNVDLSEVLGLADCEHFGPSYIDIHTLQRSGPLPREFLRGCGLPDRLIDDLVALIPQPIQFYTCFISYSAVDRLFAKRLHADLQNKGIRCWFDVRDIQGGRTIDEQVTNAIRKYDRLLLIVSKASMRSSWVRTEIELAREKELITNKHVLFPLALVSFETIRAWRQFNGDIGDDNARRVREFFISDFSNWTDRDAYQAALDRLCRDLQIDDQK